MSLKDRQQQYDRMRHGTGQQHDASADDLGSTSWGRQYDRPINALVDGDPVSILQPANVVGMSPVFLCVDSDGRAAFVPLSDVIITDPAFVPNTRATDLINTASGGGGQQSFAQSQGGTRSRR